MPYLLGWKSRAGEADLSQLQRTDVLCKGPSFRCQCCGSRRRAARAQEQELAVSGRNWGAAAVQGSTLVFSVGSKPAFRVPLKDVGGVQQAAQEARMSQIIPSALSASTIVVARPMAAHAAKGWALWCWSVCLQNWPCCSQHELFVVQSSGKCVMHVRVWWLG